MTSKLTNVMVALVLGGAFAAGTLSSCDDDDDNPQTTGTAGTTGTGTGGTGTNNTSTYSMTLTGAQEVPANATTATGSVTVTLNRTTGAVAVNGTFSGLTTPATAAHIHGPAAIGATGPVLVPLTVPLSTSGAVTGTGTMTQIQMNDMIGGMTYVNIHSDEFPDGEIRGQIVPSANQ
jgi:hypothetical protein